MNGNERDKAEGRDRWRKEERKPGQIESWRKKQWEWNVMDSCQKPLLFLFFSILEKGSMDEKTI